MARIRGIHPVAEVFPLLKGAEYKQLREDILQHGLREPVVLHNGLVVDGRNRYNACKDLGKQIRTRPWDGKGTLVDFVISQNLHRRHLTVAQRGIIAAELVEGKFAEEGIEKKREAGSKSAPGRLAKKHEANLPHVSERAPQSRDKAAAMMNVSPRSVQNATAIKEADPRMAEKVKAGGISLASAQRQLVAEKKMPSPPPKQQSTGLEKLKALWRRCGDVTKKEFRTWLKTH